MQNLCRESQGHIHSIVKWEYETWTIYLCMEYIIRFYIWKGKEWVYMKNKYNYVSYLGKLVHVMQI